jgi:hypothetical protein
VRAMPPFPSLPHDPGSHLRLWFYAAVGRLIDSVDSAGAIERFPFLAGYRQEMHAHLPGDAPGTLSERWLAKLRLKPTRDGC